MLSALRYSHELLAKIVEAGDTVIDATAGNGNDTLFLAQLVGENGCVYSFDIQETAIFNTKERLLNEGQSAQVHLIQAGHEKVDEYVTEDQIKAAVFNLGYLPKGDKAIVTKPATTITAVEKILAKLVKKGLTLLVLYSGHPEGKVEKNELLTFVQELPQETYSVLWYQFLNQRNEPPALVVIEKK